MKNIYAFSGFLLVFAMFILIHDVRQTRVIVFPFSKVLIFASILASLTFVLFHYLVSSDKELNEKVYLIIKFFNFKYCCVRSKFIMVSYLASLLIIFFVPSIENNANMFLPGYFIDWTEIPLPNWLRLLAAIMLTIFLPGFVFLNIVSEKYSMVEAFLFSFFLSAFYDIIIFFISIFWLRFISWDYLKKWMIYFYMIPLLMYLIKRYIISSHKNIENFSSSIKFKKVSFYNFIILSFVVAFVFTGAFSIAEAYYPLRGGDQWIHCGFATKFFEGRFTQSDSARLYWFHFFLASHFVLSGLPPINAFLSLIFLNAILPYLSFYLMTTAFFDPSRSKVPAVATVFSLFSGFGWIYALYYRLVNPTATLNWILNRATYASYDVYYALFFPVIIDNQTMFGAPAILLLIYVCLGRKIPQFRSILFTIILVFTGFLTHVIEVTIFIYFFSFYSTLCLLRRKLNEHHEKMLLSCSLGMFLSILMDITSPIRYLTNTPKFIPVILFNILTPFFIFFLSKMQDKNLLNKIRLTASYRNLLSKWLSLANSRWRILCTLILIYLYAFCFIVQQFSPNFVEIWRLTGVEAVPFYYFPVRLGIIGLFTLLFIIYRLLGGQREDRLIPMLVLLFSSTLMILVNGWLITLGYDEVTIMQYVWFSGCIISSYIFIKFLSKIKASNLSLFTKRLLTIFSISLIMINGVPSTIQKIQTYSETQQTLSSVFSDEQQVDVLNYIRRNLKPNESVLTITYYHSEELLKLFGVSSGNIIFGLGRGLAYFQPQRPETVLYALAKSNVKYIFMRQQDFDQMNYYHSYSDGLLAKLLNYLPVILSSSNITVYEVPPLSPPSDSGISLVIPRYGKIRTLFYNDFEKYENGTPPNGWISGPGWVVQRGVLRSGEGEAYLLNFQVKDFVFSFKLKIKSFGSKPYFCPIILLGWQDNNHYYRLDFRRDGIILFYKTPQGLIFVSAHSLSFTTEDWYNVRILKEGNKIKVYVNEELVLSSIVPCYSGTIKFIAPRSTFYIDDIVIDEYLSQLNYELPLLMIALSQIQYSLCLSDDPFLLNSSAILLIYDISGERYLKYLEWVRQGGHLIVMNTLGEYGFANLFGIKMMNEFQNVNGIKGKEEYVSIPSISVKRCYFNSNLAEIIANYTQNSHLFSPFALKMDYGNGDIVYLNIKPYFSALNQSIGDKKRTLFSRMGILIDVLKLPFLRNIPFSFHPIKYHNFARGKISLIGQITIKTKSILFDSTRLIALDLEKANISAINNLTQEKCYFINVTLENLKFEGPIDFTIFSENVKIFTEPRMLGEYAKIKVDNGTLLTINVPTKCVVSMTLMHNDQKEEIIVNEGTFYMILPETDLLLKQPNFVVYGKTSFDQVLIHDQFPKFNVKYDLATITINGITQFKIAYSDKDIALLSNLYLKGEIMRNQECINPLSTANDRTFRIVEQKINIPWFKIFFSNENLFLLLALSFFLPFVYEKT